MNPALAPITPESPEDRLKAAAKKISEHTPTPWRIEWDSRPDIVTQSDQGGYMGGGHIATVSKYEENIADSEFIVLACNHHDELVSACKDMLAYEQSMDGADGCGENDDAYWDAIKKMREVVAKIDEASHA